MNLVGQVADYLPAFLEEELCLVQLQSVIKNHRIAEIAAYLFLAELPSLAERCPRGSPQKMEGGHSRVHLRFMSLL